MKVLIVRHGKAEEKDDFGKAGKPDSQRPLTNEGIQEFKKVARALREILPGPDLILTSPFTRALQTAQILSDVLKVDLEEFGALEPGMKFDKVLEWLDSKAEKLETVALVGHEPDLGKLVGYSLTGEASNFAPLKKGGAAYLKFDYRVRPGLGQLKWFLSPAAILGLKDT